MIEVATSCVAWARSAGRMVVVSIGYALATSNWVPAVAPFANAAESGRVELTSR